MAWHGYACCSELPTCPNCVESCDFATSYTFDGIVLNFLHDKSYGNCPPCNAADTPEEFMQESYSVQVTLTQLAPNVLTRYGTPGVTPCYYQACGMIEMAWLIENQARFGCCDTTNGILADCDESQQISGAEMVPYCYTIRCDETQIDGCPDDSKGRAVWRHKLVVCGTRVASSHVKFVVEDCESNPDCGIEPGGGLYMSGMTFEWWTPLVDLAGLFAADANVICGPYATTDESCSCSGITVAHDNALCTPFTVYEVGTCVAPWHCVTNNSACQLGNVKFGTEGICISDLNCEFTPQCPCGTLTGYCDCARHDASWTFLYPTYV